MLVWAVKRDFFTMHKIAILGSTGSIGKNTLEVATHLRGEIGVVALAAHSNIALLREQALAFKPEVIAVYDENKAAELQKQIKTDLPKTRVVAGIEGLIEVATLEAAQSVVCAMSGFIGIEPTVAAIKHGKRICLANKEVLVSAGEYVMQLVSDCGVEMIPVDSEHNAIFQCLAGNDRRDVKRLILTASGGPFRNHTIEELKKVSVKEALKHPSWSMGPKITIDSSTLMNKGLEVIEAHFLFGIKPSQIEVVVHPKSLVHSFVEFTDHSLLAQVSNPDMKLPIQHALTYPIKNHGSTKPLDFTREMSWEFFPPDMIKFPCLQLAYAALEAGGTMPCFMNGANEVLVNRLIKEEISWIDIPKKLEKLMEQHQPIHGADLNSVMGVDHEARQRALTI